MDKTENIINSLLEIIPLSIEKLIFDTDPTIIYVEVEEKT